MNRAHKARSTPHRSSSNIRGNTFKANKVDDYPLQIFRWLLLHFLAGAVFVFPAWLTLRLVLAFTDKGFVKQGGSMSGKPRLESGDTQKGETMTARLGNVLFWASILLAALWLYAMYGPGGVPNKSDMSPLAMGAVIVLIGWALR
jgi:hypothetical protein